MFETIYGRKKYPLTLKERIFGREKYHHTFREELSARKFYAQERLSGWTNTVKQSALQLKESAKSRTGADWADMVTGPMAHVPAVVQSFSYGLVTQQATDNLGLAIATAVSTLIDFETDKKEVKEVPARAQRMNRNASSAKAGLLALAVSCGVTMVDNIPSWIGDITNSKHDITAPQATSSVGDKGPIFSYR